MKKIIFPALALTAMTLTTTVSNAQTAVAEATEVQTAQAGAAQQEAAQAAQDQRTQIELSALPEGVKKVLATDNYKEWQATSAWQVKTENKEFYVIELQKGEEKANLQVDADGNPVG